MQTGTIRHCTPEDFEDYFSGLLSEPETARLMGHLSGCPECMERAKRIGDALIGVDTWMMETRAEAVRAERIGLALARAEARETSHPKQERFRTWRHRVESSEGSGREPRRLRYAVGETQKRGALRVRGPAPTRGANEGLARVDWKAGVEGNRIVLTERQPVRIGIDEGSAGQMVALVPVREDQDALFAEVARDGTAWVARFEAAGPGEYTIVLEDKFS